MGRICASFGKRTKSSFRAVNMVLVPGKVSEILFDILIELSGIHSEKIINALRDHLVSGEARKISCELYGASTSYFSVDLGRLFHVCQLASRLAPYYYDDGYSFECIK
ncbi:transcriptional regulator [Salmonella enterica]|uniref:Transcriptional regulator n=2 Tax=Salmonella enterica TaxID=28901 RepID=A0A8E7D0H7_SALNE|nr:transcriptional regulator [Salmonella enterica subsp. enterica]EAO1735785.1 transcriptional regulator [Salmonella enterica]EDP2140844.1 transcriptional regulator [Salmonella enterica subsp. enterica serovar Newport]EEM0288891.1 transcriptional regulator [Salmonella enterica subsp. enterica serovar Sandiego]EAO9907380.1 transcriptional regulator [Salmonella enterica]